MFLLNKCIDIVMSLVIDDNWFSWKKFYLGGTSKEQKTIFTIGHSTHPINEFIDILKKYDIHKIVDVRSYPGSKYAPQYNEARLVKSLKEQHIAYIHLPALGGLRPTKKDSINTGWINKSFRGYADYMQTKEFTEGINQLIDIASTLSLRAGEPALTATRFKHRIAIMCAEAVPWRCHRSLIGDALLVRGFTVMDILSKTYSRPHKITPWAVVHGKTITYPGHYVSSKKSDKEET